MLMWWMDMCAVAVQINKELAKGAATFLSLELLFLLHLFQLYYVENGVWVKYLMST